MLWAASQELIKYVKISLSWLLLDHSGLREGGREGGEREEGREGEGEGGREEGRMEGGRKKEGEGGGGRGEGLSEAVRSEELNSTQNHPQPHSPFPASNSPRGLP